jgi:thiamine biosynthesis lipoprotein
MKRFHYDFRAMACDNIVEVYAGSRDLADAAAHAAIAEVTRIEAKYSRYREDSVVSEINRAAGVEVVAVDEETRHLLNYADVCYQQSGGLFDITSGVLRRVWNFKADRPPTREALATLLPLVGWQRVVRVGANVALPDAGMELDFGGFGKEYAADRAAAMLLSFGLRHAHVNLGGDVVVTGPHADGTPWQMGIRHPRRDDALLATLPISTGAVATSGDYERFLDFEGRRHSHILDPRTGESVTGLQSVTVMAPTCLVAGSIATIAMLKGNAGGASWLQASGAAYLAVEAAGEVMGNL